MRIEQLALPLLLLLVLVSHDRAYAGSKSADEAVKRAIDTMGGEERLRGIKNVHIKAVAHRYAMEQSERPEPPYLIEYQEIEEWHDYEHQSWRQNLNLIYPSLPSSKASVIVRDGVAVRSNGADVAPAGGQQLEDAAEALALSPERILAAALVSPDLRLLNTVKLQESPQTVVEFKWKERLLRLYLSTQTGLPTALTWKAVRSFDNFWGVWGDCTTEIFYSFWSIQNNVRAPLQLDIYRNGFLERNIEITEFRTNENLDSQLFAISNEDERKAVTHPLLTIEQRKPQDAKQISDGVLLFPGAWNVAVIDQGDGLVVVEAPISSGYSANVLTAIRDHFQKKPIKAVITTSDAWPHIGGLREYVARGIPIYVLDKNIPIISRLVRSQHTLVPDSLQRRVRRPILRPVSGKIMIGSGPNKIEIFPLRGETTERQLLVYLPRDKLLYGSDAFQRGQDGGLFTPQTFSEVTDVVDRERLQVEKFWMMHLQLSDWAAARNEFESLAIGRK